MVDRASRSRPLLSVILLVTFVAAACSAESPAAEPATAVEGELPGDVSHLSMALEALEVIDRPGTYVVPSDVGVLALDADALADLATANGIRDIVDQGELVSPIGQSGVEEDSVLLRSSAAPLRVTSNDEDQLLVEGLPFREVIEWGEYQLVVIDGVLGVTKVAAE